VTPLKNGLMKPSRFRTLLPAFLTAATVVAAGSLDRTLFQAIRNHDTVQIRALLQQGISPNSTDASGTTALMYATLHTDVATMKLLLDRGADPNIANQGGTTALMWAAGDYTKAKLLLDRGANPNARSKEGRTALLVATRQSGSAETIRALVAKGADPNATDALGGTALMLAAETGDVEVVKLLIEKGANMNQQASPGFGMPRIGNAPNGPPPDPATGYTALIAAGEAGNLEVVKLLLEKGADPNRRMVMGFTPLMMATQRGDVEAMRLLLAKGADLESREMRNATALILAASSDQASPEVIQLLLEKGADLKATDAAGKTALDWALLRGHTPIVAMLRRAASGQSEEQRITEAVNRSLALLQAASVEFVKKSGCISCHNQSILQTTVAAARERGFTVDEEKAAYIVKFTAGFSAPHRGPLLEGVPTIPVTPFVSSYALVGMAAERYPANDMTDAMVFELAARQRPDGRWLGDIQRPPLGQGDITSTAMTLRALQLYTPPAKKLEFSERIRRAATFLAANPGKTSQEKVMRVLGLAWAGGQASALEDAGRTLLAQQRPDGGWAQMPTLESDAYATGQALTALLQTGVLKPTSAEYARGVAFLLDTQLPDGSWHVRSRAFGFQKYFEGGYPHGHDQWISAAGGAWATMALAMTREPSPQLAQVAP
jgi:ankyrin repeat protein